MLTISKTCPPTPAEAKALAERLSNTLSGDELHKAFDQASNSILSSLGYSDFVEAFFPNAIPDPDDNPRSE